MGDQEKDEIKHLEREVDRLRRIYDDYRVRSLRARKDLDILKDSVKDLELDSQRPHMEDNEFTRRIRSLENKLDKAMIKYNEAQSIRKTYEQILRRLQEERVGFDNQLSAIERTLQAKQRDYDELLLLAGDANHARETALLELEKVRAQYEDERKKREKQLRERHNTIQLRKQMLERMKLRDKLRNQLAGGSPGKSPNSPDSELRNSMNQKSLLLEKIESRNKVNIFENAFRKIKEATGVSDVNEVIQKIISQESTTENLINVTRENQMKIETLNEMRKKIKLHCEELKYSGVGGGQHRKIVDSFEDQLANASTRLERSRLKYERLSKMVISMKAGIGHLQDKLENFREEINGKTFIISDETVADALHECDLCFTLLLKRSKAIEDDQRRAQLQDMFSSPMKGHTGGAVSSSTKGPIFSTSLEFLSELDNENVSNLNTLRPYNQRIDLNANEDNLFNVPASGTFVMLDGSTIGANGVMDMDGPDMDDDELTRDKVKRASTQILLAMDKKKKKMTKNKKGSERSGGGGGGHHAHEDEQSTTSGKNPFK